MNFITGRSLLVVTASLIVSGSLAAQERRLSPTRSPIAIGSPIQVIRLTAAPVRSSMTRVAAPVTAGLTAEQKIQMATEALGTARAVHGAEAPIRITPATPRVPGRARIMLNRATMVVSDGALGGDGEFRLGGESSYLQLNLSLPQPSQPHLLECLVQGKPGVITVVVRAGTAAMQTSVQPGWQHVGWLLYPEGAGNYSIELSAGPHYLLQVQYCEITPLN